MPASCSAARAGIASFNIGFLPFVKFDISFIGTGTAVMKDDIEFSRLKVGDNIEMEWVANKFIGEHWLLGHIVIDLNKEFRSKGRVEDIKIAGNRNQGLNINEFYFKFTFPRWRCLTISNKQPIINSSVVFNIPPTEESSYALDKRSRSVKVVYSPTKETTLHFDFCDITLFPERNILTEVTTVTKLTNGSYQISVRYTNLTSVTATCAYFLVLHDLDLITKDDYGFKRVKGGQSFTIDYLVSHHKGNVQVDLPIFGGLYLPEYLRGSSQKSVLLEF